MRQARILVARIGAAHGTRGDVRLQAFTADPMAIANYGVLENEDATQRFEITSLRQAKGFLVARFAGIDDRNAAERLKNLELFVPRERLPALDEAETYYHADLIGLEAVDGAGARLGTVVAIQNFGAGDLLEIAPDNQGSTMLLPFTKTWVPAIDFAARRLIVDVPDDSVSAESAAPRVS